MLVPPQEPDQAPELTPGACEHDPPSMLRFSSGGHLEGSLPQDNEKATSTLH